LVIDPGAKPYFHATWGRLGCRQRGSAAAFATIEECRAYLDQKLAEEHEKDLASRRRGVATRKRRKEEQIAKIVRDYLLGQHIGNRMKCAICGRALSDPPSIERGIGSECWPELLERLALEIPRCEARIAKFREEIADREKKDWHYWEDEVRRKARSFAPDEAEMFRRFVNHEFNKNLDRVGQLRRWLADAELLLAAARKWETTK
jgi:hypothetical protein